MSNVTAPGLVANPEGVDLDQVVSVVNEALVEAQSNNVKGFPELNKAVLQLSSTITKEGEGKFKFIVISIGGSKGRDTAVTLSVGLTVPTTTVDEGIAVVAVNPNLKSVLAQAINQAKAAFVQTNQGIGKLKPSEIEVEVKFGIKKSRNGGIDSGDLLPLGIEWGAKVEKEETHSVTLTFGEGK